jgi:aldoxime dehydratase
MESAIPQRLRCPRTHARRIPDEYTPPFPSTVARFKPSIEQVVMAYFGLQYPAQTVAAVAEVPLQEIADALGGEHGSKHWDRARYVDEAGFMNVLSIGYWDQPTVFERWFSTYGANWTNGTNGNAALGMYCEVLKPSIERFETLFSSDIPEGVACMAERLSDVVQEHGYWGGARDRVPLSQTHDLAPIGAPQVLGTGLHRRVTPHENICLIRSGQDWGATTGAERRMYLEEVEPVLRAGMNFLRDEGLQVGCYANRYMDVLDRNGVPTEKRFGMSWWKCLSALEHWAQSHPTHLAIFSIAMKYLHTMGAEAKVRLYHEVSIASTAQQYFEYYNCHPQTGMLRAAQPI